MNGTSYGELFDLEWLRSLSESAPAPPKSPRSLLQIYADMCADPSFKAKKYNPDELIQDRIKNALKNGNDAKLREMVTTWSLTDKELGDGPEGWRRKVKELDLLATLMACATTRRGYEKKVDFFLVRLVSRAALTFRCTVLPRPSSRMRSCRCWMSASADCSLRPMS